MGRKQIHAGSVVDLGLETVDLPGGERIELEVVRHVGAAAVLPVLESDEVVLVRQFRHATGGWLLEAPAGKRDPGEDPRRCALRETEEETGMRAGRLHELGWIWTTPGFCDEKIWLYLATDLKPGEQKLESDEVLSLVTLPFGEALLQAQRGEIVDAKTLCLLLRADALRRRSNGSA
ncbi:MAG: NUDIX hydrolase [Acidobacteriota bacterium]